MTSVLRGMQADTEAAAIYNVDFTQLSLGTQIPTYVVEQTGLVQSEIDIIRSYYVLHCSAPVNKSRGPAFLKFCRLMTPTWYLLITTIRLYYAYYKDRAC